MFTTETAGVTLIAVSAWSLLIYIVWSTRGRRFAQSRLGQRRSARVRPGANSGPDLTDIGHQILAVSSGSFQRRRLLNRSEFHVFKIVESDLAATRLGYRVFAQTSLGEILTSPDSNAFRSINSKRVDFLIVDRAGWPVISIEYQGEGHFQGNARHRDTVKREALCRAGVGYVEIDTKDSAEQIRSCVRQALGRQATRSYPAA